MQLVRLQSGHLKMFTLSSKELKKTVTFKGHQSSHWGRDSFSTIIHFKERIQTELCWKKYKSLCSYRNLKWKRWNLVLFCRFTHYTVHLMVKPAQHSVQRIQWKSDALFLPFLPPPPCLSSLPLSESFISLCSLFLKVDENERVEPNKRRQQKKRGPLSI